MDKQSLITRKAHVVLQELFLKIECMIISVILKKFTKNYFKVDGCVLSAPSSILR